eukprot:365230-Chlamydomonas_euryale.AAC.4
MSLQPGPGPARSSSPASMPVGGGGASEGKAGMVEFSAVPHLQRFRSRTVWLLPRRRGSNGDKAVSPAHLITLQLQLKVGGTQRGKRQGYAHLPTLQLKAVGLMRRAPLATGHGT